MPEKLKQLENRKKKIPNKSKNKTTRYQTNKRMQGKNTEHIQNLRKKQNALLTWS